MDTINPSPTICSPRGGGAATDAFGSSELASTGAVLGSPRHRILGGGIGGSGSVSPSAVTQVIRIGDLESIVSSTGIVVAPVASMEVGTSSVTHDRSPRSTVAATSSLLDDGSAEAQQESSEYGSGSGSGSGGGNAVKKPAWNKLSNVATAEVVTSVMGAESWPALSEAARASPKSLSSESLKVSSDGLLSVAQGSGATFLSSPKQEKSSHAILNSTPNYTPFNRQRSMKRGGGSSSNSVVANGSSSQNPLRSPAMDTAPNNLGRQGNYANDSSSKDNLHQDSVQRGGFGSHSDGGNGHQSHRNSFKRGNGGPHSRGDGYHHNSFGGRRSNDHERGSHDWNSNRSFPARDTHIQPQRGPLRPSMRGPPSPPFILPPQMAVHPYGGMPVMYPDMQPVMYFPGPHSDPYRPVALGPLMPPMIYAFPPHLEFHSELLGQIEYYFSNENLIKDMFLRQRMDDQGWVHITLIAGFKKVRQLTDSIPLILDVLKSSRIVEVEGEKLRRRGDWMKWVVQYPGGSSTQSTEDTLAANLQNTNLDDKAPPKHGGGGGGGLAETNLSSSSSGELNGGFSTQSSQIPVHDEAETSLLDSR